MREHTLKTLDVCWDAAASGEKTFEVRRDDRCFQRGDTVILRKVNELGREIPKIGAEHWKPQDLHFRIGWILTGGKFGIEPGYIVFSLEEIE